MAKQSGLSDYLAVDDSGGTVRDISADVTNVAINVNQNLQDITGLDKSAIERLVLLSDGEMTINGIFNAAANLSHAVFSNRANTRTVTYAVGGNTMGNPRLSMEMLIENYNLTRGADGSLTWSATVRLQSGTVPVWDTVP